MSCKASDHKKPYEMPNSRDDASDAVGPDSRPAVGGIMEFHHPTPGVEEGPTLGLGFTHSHQTGGLGNGGDTSPDRSTTRNKEFVVVKDRVSFPDMFYNYENDCSFVKHWVIKSNSFATRNVFLQSKLIQHAISGSMEGVRMRRIKDPKTHEHRVEVAVETARQADALKKVTKLGQDDVEVEQHPYKNLLHGVFYDDEGLLDKMEEKERNQGLTDLTKYKSLVKKIRRCGKLPMKH